MDPIEINAGQWYLRGLRADERIDDRPALAELGATDPDHVARSEADWSSDARYSWAVCEPTTGELLAEVTLNPSTGDVAVRARPGHDDAVGAAAKSVRRFADAIVGIQADQCRRDGAEQGLSEGLSGVVGPQRPE